MALHRLHASQRSACNDCAHMVLPDLSLLLYRGLQKDLQHGLFIATAAIGIGVAFEAYRVQLQTQRFTRNFAPLQALPLV